VGAIVLAGCSSTSAKPKTTAKTTAAREITVSVALTRDGCVATPSQVGAGHITFNISNSDSRTVSEVELQTANHQHILGEQENLTVGASGGFSLNLQAGTYAIACPGAASPTSSFVVAGKVTQAGWQKIPALVTAVRNYGNYINLNIRQLITTSITMCGDVTAGNLAQAKLDYPKARIYYERVEPVAEVWGSLDTEIDGRLGNPVTNVKQFMGFHRLEQLMWTDNTLHGAVPYCARLVVDEDKLRNLVSNARYSPFEMVAGSTDLINEAAKAKISGEEERYSDTDLVVFAANLDGAREVVYLLRSYLTKKQPALLSTIDKRYAAVQSALAPYISVPGYDDTGYVNYSTVTNPQRRRLSGAVNAYAEALSNLSSVVS
jgi:iron uptake system component EfeO